MSGERSSPSIRGLQKNPAEHRPKSFDFMRWMKLVRLDVLQVDTTLLDHVLMHTLAVLARACQPRGHAALTNPKAATIAWVGQPWLSKVRISVTTSAAVRNR